MKKIRTFRIISSILFLAMIMSIFPIDVYAVPVDNSEHFTVDGKAYTMELESNGNTRTAIIREDEGGSVDILQIDDSTGVLTFNGEPETILEIV